MPSHSLVLEFLDKARHCQSVEELSALTQSIFEGIGFPLWAYQTESQPLSDKDEPILVHNFPRQWESHYVENKCFEVDPVIKYGKDIVTPFQWSAVTMGKNLSREELDYQEVAHQHGMRDGLAIPLIGVNGKVSMISLTTDMSKYDFSSVLHAYQDQIIALSYAFHSIAKDLIRSDYLVSSTPKLTARERECLLWTAKNKSSWEVSMILGISKSTVNFHLDNARKKYGVANKYHLIVKAIASGELQV